MRETVRTERAPAPNAGAPYSQAVCFGDLVFTAGVLGVDPATGKLVEGGIEAETDQAMRNLAAILEAAGSSWSQALKTTVFLRSRDDWAAMNEVYRRYVGDAPPARSAIEVGRLGFDALVEIEVVAARTPSAGAGS